jgi:antitoxin VapB
MSNQRRVRLFRNGRNQAVRIPVEFELPGNEAIMHRDGDRRVIEPVRKRGLIGLLKSMTPLDEEFPQLDDPVPAPERALVTQSEAVIDYSFLGQCRTKNFA